MNTITPPASPFPRRHCADPQAWTAMIRPLRLFNPRRSFPDRALCDAYGHGLMRGDEPMDRLLDWMNEGGLATTRPLFVQALEHGIDSLSNPPQPLRAFFTVIDRQPTWLDERRMQRGAEAYAMMGGDVFFSARDFILMGGYLSSSINEVLYRAGGLKMGANRRIAETTDWYLKSMTPGAMSRFGDGFKATVHVRFVHALIRRRIQAQSDWASEVHGLPCNQTDMVATYLGGSWGAILGALLLGRLSVSYADVCDMLHLFRYNHWLMGVEDDFLSDDPREMAHRLANLVWTQPGPSDVCRQMAEALAQQPMEIDFASFTAWRRRWRRHTHLSRNRYFLGRQGMQRLGLSPSVLPWYPMLTSGPKAAYWLVQRFLRRSQARGALVRRGRAEQERLLDEVYGDQARHISPQNAGHALGRQSAS